MDFDGLTPISQDDGSIWLVNDEASKNAIFILQAPYMYDANGEISYNVVMAIEDNVLQLIADDEWLNDESRVFPIVIDPTITTDISDFTSIHDTYVSSVFTNTNYINSGKLYAGKTLLERNRSYIKFDLPNLPDDCEISNAKLKLRKVATSLADIRLNAYDCANVNSWNPNNITWNNQPIATAANGYKNKSNLPLLDYDTGITIGSTIYRFIITEAVANWYDGGTNNGILIASDNENSLNQVDLFSSNYSNVSDHPALIITYTTNTAGTLKIHNTPQIGQERNTWCWVAAALMMAKTKNPNTTVTQSEMVASVKGAVVDGGGHIDEATEAAEFAYDGEYPRFHYITRPLTESELVYRLDNNGPVYVELTWYDSNDVGKEGHAIVVYGYHVINNIYVFHIRDPWPVDDFPWPSVNEGQSYERTYNKITDNPSYTGNYTCRMDNTMVCYY